MEQQRNDIKRRYKRGRTERRIASGDSLTDVEREVKKQLLCFLKAQDFSYTYISEALGISKTTLKQWMQEPEMQAEVKRISEDFVAGAVKLAKTYAIEMIEILVDIARGSDDKTAIQAATEILDRVGLTKVNKSEAKTVHEEKTHATYDTEGLLEAVRSLPPELQHAAAKHAGDLGAVIEEGKE